METNFTVLRDVNSTTLKTINLLSDWEEFQPAWDRFVEHHPKGSVFHTSAMIQVFAEAKGQLPMALAKVGTNGEIVAMLVAIRVQTLPTMFGAVSSRSVWYAEPLCVESDEGQDALCELVRDHDRQLQRRTLFAEVRPLHASGAERPALERCGYQYLDYLNYLVDTSQPVETLWKRLSGSARSYVRKCEKQRYEMQLLASPACVDVLYDFLKMTYSRAGVPLASRSLFDAAYRILKPRNMIEFVVVYDGDKPVAADTMLVFKNRVFAWYGGSLRITGMSPAAFMQWREIEWASANGHAIYDFGGAGWPDVPYGVRDFKASFGGELVCYGRYRKIYSRWRMALAERAYELGRNVISPK